MPTTEELLDHIITAHRSKRRTALLRIKAFAQSGSTERTPEVLTEFAYLNTWKKCVYWKNTVRINKQKPMQSLLRENVESESEKPRKN